MAKKNTEVTTEATNEALAELAAMFPQGDTYNRTQLPKLVFKSQTKLDDDDKVIMKAGTFLTERPTDEEDDNGKKKWQSDEIGKELDGHIILYRKRLQMWDQEAEEFTSSPMYDEDHEVIPLFKGGSLVATGTPAELRAMYPELKTYVDKNTGEQKTKTVSKLRDARVIYLLVNGELLELTIQGTSMYSFLDYLKKTAAPTVITTLNSIKKEQGATKWNQITFKALRTPTTDEASLALKTMRELQEGIKAEKEYYAKKRAAEAVSDNAPAIGAADPLAIGAPETEDEDF